MITQAQVNTFIIAASCCLSAQLACLVDSINLGEKGTEETKLKLTVTSLWIEVFERINFDNFQDPQCFTYDQGFSLMQKISSSIGFCDDLNNLTPTT